MKKKMSNNIISLSDRLETWKTSFEQESVSVNVSSNGRMMIQVEGRIAYLDTVSAVNLMSKVSEAYEKEFNVLFEDD
jgi:hypothetical protein